jgi:peptide-methionine (S)-S-oxide reductase
MPSFISRLFRPFSSATSLGVNAAGGGGPIHNPEGAAKATVAAGCFWGVEHMYRKEFTGKGLYDARVGYIGGDSTNPSYRDVCSGRTGRMLPFFDFLLFFSRFCAWGTSMNLC